MIENPLASRLLPAPKQGGFRQDSHWVWCGSVIRASEDGRYHMFASRWPKGGPFGAGWLFNSEIVRAVSDTPEGPYKFEEVVLPRRDRSFFDGMNTHNPAIRFWEGRYYLYYMGTTYVGPAPKPDEKIDEDRIWRTWDNKRIGLAVSNSVFGPWERLDRPLLEPRPGKWDATVTTNPAPVILADGKSFMIYKSRRGYAQKLQLGVATASTPSGPYSRAKDEPILQFDHPDWHVEDPFAWHDGERFHAVLKDDFKNDCGGITGDWGSGVHATSDDGMNWAINPTEPKAYTRTVQWDDGSVTMQANLERPHLLFSGGKPTHLFAATGTGPQPYDFTDSWNMCIPLC